MTSVVIKYGTIDLISIPIVVFVMWPISTCTKTKMYDQSRLSILISSYNPDFLYYEISILCWHTKGNGLLPLRNNMFYNL